MLLAALLAFVLALAACGGDDDEGSTTTGDGAASTSEGASGAAEEAKSPDSPPPTENLLLGGSTYTGTPTEEPTVKLGWVSDEAGKVGTYGPNMTQASELLVDLMNKDGGIMGHPVEFIARDSQVDPAVAFREARDLIQSEQINAFFNGVLSTESLAIVPLAQQFKIPFIAGGDGALAIVGEKGSIYQGMVDSTSQVDACSFAKFQGEKHPEWKRVALFKVASDYGTEHADFYKECLAKYMPDAEIVTEKSFEGGTSNFLPFINSMLAKKPDLIMASTFGTDTVNFYKQYAGTNPDVPFATFMDLDTAKALGNKIKPGLVYGYARAFYPNIPTAEPWVKAYEEKYGEPPSDYGLTQMGAILAYKAAVEKAGTLDGTEVMEAFRCLTYYEPRGWVTIRALNGQGNTPEYLGQLVPNEQAGLPTFDPDDSAAVYAGDIWQSDEDVKEDLPSDAQRDESDCK